MDMWATESCCACMVTANVSTMYSLSDVGTMRLFKECTNISYHVDEGNLPQHLCTLCYKQCEIWKCFKTRCEETQRLMGYPATEEPQVEDDDEAQQDVQEVIEEEVYHNFKSEVEEDEYVNLADDYLDNDSYDPLSGDVNSSMESPATNKLKAKKKGRKEHQLSRKYDADKDYQYRSPPTKKSKPSKAVITMIGNVSKVSHNLYMKTYRDFLSWKNEQGDAEIDEELMLRYFQEISKTLAPTTLTNKLSHLVRMIEDFHNVRIDGYQRVRQFCRDVRMQGNKSTTGYEVSD